MNVKALVQAARPWQWIKNLIVLFPVVFSLSMDDSGAWCLAALATAAFCLASSAVYVVNDLRDRRADQAHPRKRNRPIASGRLGAGAAAIEAVVLLAGATAVALQVNVVFAGVLWAYILMQMAYTFALKQRALVDVFCIALGFVLRAAGGAVAIQVEISPWLFLCTFTLCLFLGFCKRYSEIASFDDADAAKGHRPTLAAYDPQLLTHLITLSASVAVVTFLLYAASQRVIDQFGSGLLIYTVPLVIYGVFRFAMLSMRGRYGDPTELILRDRAFQLTVVLWVAATVAIIFWGEAFEQWLRDAWA